MIRILVVHKVRLTCELIAGSAAQRGGHSGCGNGPEWGRSAGKTRRAPGRCGIWSYINLPETDALRFTRAGGSIAQACENFDDGRCPVARAVLRCIEEGAAGYVLEDDVLGEFVRKIRRVCMATSFLFIDIGGALLARLAELKRQVMVLRSNSRAEKEEALGEVRGELTWSVKQEILSCTCWGKI